MKAISKIEEKFIKTETTYDLFDHKHIYKCICHAYHGKNSYAECVFFDKNNNEVNSITFKNNMGNAAYPLGLAISYDGTKLYGTSYNKIDCRLFKTGELLWQNSIKDLFRIFVKNDKLYCSYVKNTSVGGMMLIDEKNGDIIENIYSYKTKLHHPDVFKINETLLLIYIESNFFIIDMQKNKMFLSNFKVDKLAEECSELLVLYSALQKNDSIKLEFKDWNLDLHQWISHVMTVDINELLDNAQLVPLNSRIPTSKKTLNSFSKQLGEEKT